MTKRFDRIGGKKYTCNRWGRWHILVIKEPRLCSYEMAAGYMREINLPMKDIEQYQNKQQQ
ncbi:MAG: hypothetical protein SOW32_13200 [Agathobacter sp.]|nr:hypothetical protein [Agathobacter sp.]